MYHVDIVNTGEYAFKVKAKDYEFVMDPRGKGVTPPDALLASLGTCIGVYLRKYAEGAG
ncbi:MAG: OsmC family protein [Candidatus Omnitrophica bacterium]|nr:OsmC family protein [Candidatus Omnitrophota bacterium]